jgi:hypothetical protein
MTVRTALFLMVQSVVTNNATFVIKPGGTIEITPWATARKSKATIAYPMPVKASGELLATLNTVIETKDLQQPLPMRKVYGVLSEQMVGKKKAFPLFIRLDVVAYDTQVKLPAQTPKMTLGNALQALVNQIPQTRMVIRQGFIQITDTRDLSAEMMR